jgi:flagellar basal-body rod protein FlgB
MLRELIMSGDKNAALAKSLDARMARQKVIVNNIANVATPGYHRKEVKFEESLAEALDRSRLQGARTNSKHFEIGRPKIGDVQFEVIEPVDHTMSSGVNNVDIDFETAQLAENQIGFSYAMKLLKSSHDGLNAAIQGQSKK